MSDQWLICWQGLYTDTWEQYDTEQEARTYIADRASLEKWAQKDVTKHPYWSTHLHLYKATEYPL